MILSVLFLAFNPDVRNFFSGVFRGVVNLVAQVAVWIDRVSDLKAHQMVMNMLRQGDDPKVARQKYLILRYSILLFMVISPMCFCGFCVLLSSIA